MTTAVLEHGRRYKALIRCTKIEKLLVSHSMMLRELKRSGFEDIEFDSVADGFALRGRYVGVTAEATLPDRVCDLEPLK